MTARAISAPTIATVEIAFAVTYAAHRKQGHHRAIVRQTVDRAQHCDPMHERWVHAICYSELPVGFAEGIQHDVRPPEAEPVSAG
jgi:hypothetical protein